MSTHMAAETLKKPVAWGEPIDLTVKCSYDQDIKGAKGGSRRCLAVTLYVHTTDSAPLGFTKQAIKAQRKVWMTPTGQWPAYQIAADFPWPRGRRRLQQRNPVPVKQTAAQAA